MDTVRSAAMAGSGTEPRTRVVIADDYEPTRVLLRALIEFASGVEVVGEA